MSPLCSPTAAQVVCALDVLAQLYAVRRERRAQMEAAVCACLPEAVSQRIARVAAPFEEELDGLDSAIAESEAQVKTWVLELEASVMGQTLHAVYRTGAVTWDSQGLLHYAKGHPDREPPFAHRASRA
jgi:hypothetical protein